MLTLEAAPRQVTGKQVKALRRDGIIPGVVYGPKQDAPEAVQISWQVLRPLLQEAGGTSLINLDVAGKTVEVLVRSVQRNPIRPEEVLHIDFYAVDTESTLHVTVPISVPNMEALGKRIESRIFQPLKSIDVETLPANIPSVIVVDTSRMSKPGDVLTVAQLPELEGVTYLQELDTAVVRSVSLAAIEAAAEAAEAAEADEAAEAAGLEPEVIGRGEDDEGEEF